MSPAVVRNSVFLVASLLLAACQPMPVVEQAPPAQKPAPEVTCTCPPETPAPAPAPELEPKPEPPLTPPPAVSKPCPKPKPAISPITLGRDLLLVGRVENAYLKLDGTNNSELKLKARIDTGAGISSLNAQDVVEFERDGKPWVRFAVLEPDSGKPMTFERKIKDYATIKQLDGSPQKRPVVNMTIRLGDLTEHLDVNLSDRTGYLYQLLVGRNFLRDHAVVDVSRKFIADDGLHVK